MHALQKAHIRKGDTVVVIAGRDRGKSGKVLSVDRSAGKVMQEPPEGARWSARFRPPAFSALRDQADELE